MMVYAFLLSSVLSLPHFAYRAGFFLPTTMTCTRVSKFEKQGQNLAGLQRLARLRTVGFHVRKCVEAAAFHITLWHDG